MRHLCLRVSRGRVLAVVLCVGGLIALLAWAAAVLLNHTVNTPAQREAPVIVMINAGNSVRHIARMLRAQNLIPSAAAFEIYVRWHRLQGKLQAGEYFFAPHATILEILDKMARGDVVLHPVRVGEGWISQQILAALNDNAILCGPAIENLPEATVLPETYHLPRGHARRALLQTLQQAHQRFVQQLWAARRADLPYQTLPEALALASLVEKETALAHEKPRVAAVFVNRLKSGMRLQADPAVIYGLYHETGHMPQDLSRADLVRPTPFNTYMIPGLPPAPICHPSKSSILAAFFPLETQELYFVADGTGGHIFANTYAQHRLNHQKWRRIRAQDPETRGRNDQR